MNKFPSIFNDVIGPVMTGPSSSHTAGPVRIGKLARQFAEGSIIKADIFFETMGSFAKTYKGQRSDKGLAGGLLGWEPEDIRMVNALTEAKQRGLIINFFITDFEAQHPNTVKLVLTDNENTKYAVTGTSIGGGMVEIIEFNGFSISVSGDYYELIITGNSGKTDYNLIVKLLKNYNIEPEKIVLNEKTEGTLINIKLCEKISEDLIKKIKNLGNYNYVKLIEPVLPILSGKNHKVPFSSVQGIINYAEAENKDLYETALFYECSRGGIKEDEAFDKMEYILKIMKRSIEGGISNTGKMPYILQHQAHLVKEAHAQGRLLDLGILNEIIYSSMACMETSSSMGVIAAAPTAGSCGIIPGTLIPICRHLDLNDEDCIKALFCAGLIGVLIAASATFSAETCGCQAECGSASSMAAAGIVYLAGGDIKQSLAAASMALQNVLGLVCDPVAGLAEIPCMSRNIMAASNAVSCANMALSGVNEIIPLEEVIKAMYDVGGMLPPELRCTCQGGLAVTETGQKLSRSLQQIKY